MTDRDYFAAAALIRGMGVLGCEQIAKSCYEMADAMLRERERERTNHDAAPEATANADGEPAPKCGGEAGLSSRDGTGNTPSKAETAALEFVVEEGRTASIDDYGILRSWLIRLRPEWEHQSYEESDEKRTNTTMNRDTTHADGSVQGEGTLTDEELDAIEHGLERLELHYDTESEFSAGTLRKLLKRMR
jgi:hypothetical protein